MANIGTILTYVMATFQKVCGDRIQLNFLRLTITAGGSNQPLFQIQLLIHHQGSDIRALIIVDLNHLLLLSAQEDFINS